MKNKVLILSGNKLKGQKWDKGGDFKTPKKINYSIKKITYLKNMIQNCFDFWKDKKVLNDYSVIQIKYIQTIAKSNRIKSLLKEEKKEINECVIGSEYDEKMNFQTITYFLKKETLEKTIELLNKLIDHLYCKKIDNINADYIESIENEINGIPKTTIKNVFREIYYIEKIFVKNNLVNNTEVVKNEEILTTFYNLDHWNIDYESILKNINIDVTSTKKLDNSNLLLTKFEFDKVKEKIPFLVSMGVENMMEYNFLESKEANSENILLNEEEIDSNLPVIGVIDTLFSKDSYYSDYVEFHDLVSEDIPKESKDYIHGTKVSSLIVDPTKTNKKLEDNCGKFKVRHFGVGTSNNIHISTLFSTISDIIENNRDIKVWNLSLGDNKEVDLNTISYGGHFLDELQFKYDDIIFVIAGTNKPNHISEKNYRIGSPADSINSLVVNSVDFHDEPTQYSRCGNVIHNFTKPDISYYGGTKESPIVTCTSLGMQNSMGTSFAAPLVTRKVGYLIHKMGLSREQAKALIIHKSQKNEPQKDKRKIKNNNFIGWGVLPIKIEEFLETEEDEILFLIEDVPKDYKTFNYELPIPKTKNSKHSFRYKHTLSSLVKTNRLFGVDYTLTELNFKFGPMKNGKIATSNTQGESDSKISEKNAITIFSKWNNVKFEQSRSQTNKMHNTREKYDKWGISIERNERTETKYSNGKKFCIAVSIHSRDNSNYFDEFKSNFELDSWIVTEINIKEKLNLSAELEENIEFDN